MRRSVGGFMVLTVLTTVGCTNTQLRITTLNQGSTLAQLQYDMVLRNLASFAEDPWTIPWHISITAGTAQVTDAGTGHVGLNWNFPRDVKSRLFQFSPTATASRTIVQQWSTNPIAHTDALKVI
jgi:hypothetical protein